MLPTLVLRRLVPLAALLGVVALAGHAFAAERALWLRYPAISPDGHSVVFEYRGNLWKVPATGGTATPLTVGDDYNTRPVWSPDGTRIAFASDRNGNFDVFVMPADGGEAKRLTYHSADEFPTSFTPDGKAVLFTASILDAPANAEFPNDAQPELYRVTLDGRRPEQVLTSPAMYAVYDRAGKRLAYSDQKGFEMEWRKHDNSSFARQVWLFDGGTGKHTRLTAFGADNRQPVWGPDGESLFFLSERSGTFNVWRLGLADPSHPTQVTTHSKHPVRFLSASTAGDLCYAWDGELWVRPAGAESRRIEVMVAADRRERGVLPVDVTGQVTSFDVSPDGSEVAFVARGEVFVASTEHGTTRRITSTPEQERSVSFSPDGRTLLYASERGGSWKLYRTDLTDKDEPNFFNATALKESAVLATDRETFQPHFSPDGSEVAYLEERTTLKVLNLKTGKTRVILPGDMNYSYSDGDQSFEWSPDGKWLAVQFLSKTRWSSEVGLIPASGDGKLVNLTHSGYEDELPHWVMKGKVLLWRTDRYGLRTQSGEPRQEDVYAAFLTTQSFDRYRLDAAAYAQLKAKEKDKDKKDDKGKDQGKDKSADATPAAVKLPEPVPIEFEGMDDRVVRLSLSSADLAGVELSPDGETLYYLARFEKGYDLWQYVPRKKEVKLLDKLDANEASFQIDREGKKAFVLANGKLSTVDLDSGKGTPIAASARMDLDAQAERAYMFEHIWRQTFKKFLDVGMHGVDWAGLKSAYARFLPSIDNSRDFAEMISEMQGELNASHTGCRYRPTRTDGDETAALGIFPDAKYTGDGIAVAEVIEGGPLQKAGTRVKAGVVIESIDGTAIPAGGDWYRPLNHKADVPVRLGLRDPKSGARWEESVKPITWLAQQRLLYLRWAKNRRLLVDKLSGGRLGYAHIRGMNDGAYREIFEEIFGRAVEKEAIVLDTRFNGGGNLVETLTTFLSGKIYARDVPRGQAVGEEPFQRWTKPSIVVMGEGNYSDAHCFPMAYTQLGLGETVGMPVPGTCSSVWWERLQNRDLTFGIPEVALLDMQGDVMENKHLAPTYLVEPDPAEIAGGRDAQVEKAVEVLLAKLPKK
jgi:Tol biopolymer transport system component/C-terminal processing protease CtpA/Prc